MVSGSAKSSWNVQEWAGIAQRGRAIWQELEERGSANSEVWPPHVCHTTF